MKIIIRLIVVISCSFAVSACAKSAVDKAEEEYVELVNAGCSIFYENPKYRNIESEPIDFVTFDSIIRKFESANNLVDSWENDEVLITSTGFVNDSKQLKYEVIQALQQNRSMLVNIKNSSLDNIFVNRQEYNSNVEKVDKYCQDDSIIYSILLSGN